MRTPDFLTLMGCRCRKTLDSTASAWSRGLSGYLWRKRDFQNWVSVRFLMRVNGRLLLRAAPDFAGEAGDAAVSHPTKGIFKNAFGSAHCPSSCWYFWDLSTSIWPSGDRLILKRSSGR